MTIEKRLPSGGLFCFYQTPPAGVSAFEVGERYLFRSPNSNALTPLLASVPPASGEASISHPPASDMSYTKIAEASLEAGGVEARQHSRMWVYIIDVSGAGGTEAPQGGQSN